MAAVALVPEDLTPFAPDIPVAKARAMIEDALALAATVAPCITAEDFPHEAAARALLRGAILRWHEAGAGALKTAAVDDISLGFETGGQRRTLFWPSEIQQLQALCRTGGPAGAFAVDMVGTETLRHADICALRFGATYCSCGAVLTGAEPLYENLP